MLQNDCVLWTIKCSKMLQRLELRPRSHWGCLQRSSDPWEATPPLDGKATGEVEREEGGEREGQRGASLELAAGRKKSAPIRVVDYIRG